MANGTLSYGSRSLAALGFMLIATQEFYPVVLVALQAGQNAAWLAAVVATGLATLMIWPVAAVLARIPRGSLAELTLAAVGKPGLILYALLIAALFCLSGGLVLRETSEMALTAFFPHTPQTFATTALLLGAVYAGYGDSSSLVRFGRMLLGMILGAVLIIIFGTIGWGNPRYLLPFWGPGPVPLLLGAPAVTMKFGPVLAALHILAGGLSNRQVFTRCLLALMGASGLLYALVKVSLIMVWAYPLGRNIPYPLHEAARLVLGGRFFERIEGIWLLIWVLATMTYLGTLLHGAALIFTRAFGMPKLQTAILPMATVVLTVAFFPPDQATTITWHQMMAPATFLITLVLPMLLAGIAHIRLRRQAE